MFGDRLTGCATSRHPGPADAVGEVVGRLHETVAGSPQFALVLVDDVMASQLSSVAGSLHQLVGPDLLVATAAHHVAGGDTLATTRSTLVVWTLSGVDVTTAPESLHQTLGHRPALGLNPLSDGRLAVTVSSGADSPRPVAITGDGASWRPESAGFVLPRSSWRTIRAGGDHHVGPPRVVTQAEGLRISRLDHQTVHDVLVDGLDVPDGAFDGPSAGYPPLRVSVEGPNGGTLVEVTAIDHEDGGIETVEPVAVGERVQLLAYDPELSSRRLIDEVESGRPLGDRAVLTSSAFDAGSAPLAGSVPTAAVGGQLNNNGKPAAGPAPWTELEALVVEVADSSL